MFRSGGLIRVTTISAAALFVVLLAAVVVFWGARVAEATFPGANGMIAYSYEDMFERDEGIYVKDNDPSTDDAGIRLSDGSTDDQPTWSPDGQQIAFARGSDGERQIYVMDSDPTTNDAVNISNSASSDDSHPTWSADGQRIALQSDRDGDSEIYVMDTDPTTDDAIQLTNNNVDDFEPSWSPNGQQIAFMRDRDGRFRSVRDHEIYVMDPDPSTKDVTRITKNDTEDGYPDWSPNGRKIVFTGVFEGKYGIMVMNKDGSRRTEVLRRGGFEPVWSPDGRKIVFTRLIYDNVVGYEEHIFVMNRDGSGEQGISFGDDHSPSWQPIVP